jgi:hypothetical protein
MWRGNPLHVVFRRALFIGTQGNAPSCRVPMEDAEGFLLKPLPLALLGLHQLENKNKNKNIADVPCTPARVPFFLLFPPVVVSTVVATWW